MNYNFSKGDKVIVLRGEKRGWISTVNEIVMIGAGLKDLNIVFNNNPDIAYRIPSEDCKPYNVESNLEEYLTKEEKKNILYRAYSDKAEVMVAEAIKNRTLGSSLTDQVLKAVADKFIKENFENILPYMIEKFKAIIESDTPIGEDEHSRTFAAGIQWSLERAAGNYIESNYDEIGSIMKDKIRIIAENITERSLTKVVSDKMKKDLDELVIDIINASKENN